MTEGGDIGFRITLIDAINKEGIEMVPLSRIESHLVMEEGEIICDTVGKCKSRFYKAFILICIMDKQYVDQYVDSDVVEFENSFSFFRTKKVYYLISVQTQTS